MDNHVVAVGTALVVLILCSCSQAPERLSPAAGRAALAPAPDAQEAGRALANGDALYFVGNSYMGNRSGVYAYLRKAASVADPPMTIRTKASIFWGKGLQAMNTPEVRDAIESGKCGRVVITSGDLATMKEFDSLIRENGLQTVVFMTWAGRHPGHQATPEEYREATARSVETMRQMEAETGAVVVPIAVVYYDLTVRPAREGLREDYLWDPANIHQNELGIVVNSWVLYSVLAGKSPVGLDYDLPPHVVGTKLVNNPDIVFDEALRRELQERVWKIVQQWQAGETEFD